MARSKSRSGLIILITLSVLLLVGVAAIADPDDETLGGQLELCTSNWMCPP